MIAQRLSEPTELQVEEGQFLAVPLYSFRIGTWTDFSIYLRVGDRNVLYRDENYPPFTLEILQRLRQNSVHNLYILASDRSNYLRYAEKHLGDVLADPDVSSTEKAKVIYNINLHLVQEVFDKPTSAETLVNTERVIAPIVEQMLIDDEPFHALLPILSHHYSTYIHSSNVSLYAMFMAYRCGVRDPEHVRRIGVAGVVHDIGKAKVDLGILDKPGRLSEAEWNVIQLHPIWGTELLDAAGYGDSIARNVVHQHHERCDSSGYPDGLSRADISWEAKLVAIVDIFDALTTTRSYKNNMSPFNALVTMKDRMLPGIDGDLFRNLVHILGRV